MGSIYDTQFGPFTCIMPSTETCVVVVSFIIAVPFSSGRPRARSLTLLRILLPRSDSASRISFKDFLAHDSAGRKATCGLQSSACAASDGAHSRTSSPDGSVAGTEKVNAEVAEAVHDRVGMKLSSGERPLERAGECLEREDDIRYPDHYW